jgi:hypothetical protein
MRSFVGFLACLAVSATAFACSDDGDDGDPPATPEGVQGEAGLCVDLALVQRSLDRVMELDESSTIEEAEQARDALNLTLTEIQQAGEELTTAQNSELQQAFATFDGLLDSLGSGGANTSETLGPAAAPLKASAQEIQVTVDEIESESSCPQ